MKIFNALLSQENLADPIKQVQSVIQKCFDIQDLQSEVSSRLVEDVCMQPGVKCILHLDSKFFEV